MNTIVFKKKKCQCFSLIIDVNMVPRCIGILNIALLLTIYICQGESCPFSTKPHPSDCRRFYRCVTLPTAAEGYVWVPSKCGHNMLYQSDLRRCVMPGNQEMSHLCQPSMPEFPMTSISTDISEIQEYGSGDDMDMDTSEYDSSYDSEQIDELDREPELFLRFTTTPAPEPVERSIIKIITKQLQKITQLIEAIQRRPAQVQPPTAAQVQPPTAAQMNSIVDQTNIASQPWKPPADQQYLPPSGNIPPEQMQQILSHQYSLQELNNDPNKIISLGAGQHQFVTLNQYKESILPVLQGAPLQVLPCTAGLRQPNLTDCTRYYVCNQESATVFMFDCPRETAFNRDTRMCTTSEFDKCKRSPAQGAMMMMMSPMEQGIQYTIQRPMQQIMQDPYQQMMQMPQMLQKPMQMPMQQMLQKPMQQPIQQMLHPSMQQPMQQMIQPTYEMSYHPSMPQPIQQQPQQLKLAEKANQPPPVQAITRCSQLGKLPDPNSEHDYYVCLRAQSGAIEAHKMTCQKPLTFCALNSVCTTSERCK